MSLLALLRRSILLLAFASVVLGIGESAWADSAYGGTDPPTSPASPPNGGEASGPVTSSGIADTIQLAALVTILVR